MGISVSVALRQATWPLILSQIKSLTVEMVTVFQKTIVIDIGI